MIVDLERRWVLQARCSGMPPEKFFTDHAPGQIDKPAPRLQRAWDRSKRVCESCPVMRECARDSLGEVEGVWGGLDPAQRKLLRSMHSVKVRDLEGPRKVEYARLAHHLRQKVKYEARECARIMGLTIPTVGYLVDWYADYVADQNKVAPKVVTLQLPDSPRASWPTGDPGDGDAWVRYAGGVVRGYYLGQTQDDAWWFMKVPLSKEYSSAWFKAEDVQMRREMPRVVRRRVGNESRIYGTPLKRYSGDEVKQAG